MWREQWERTLRFLDLIKAPRDAPGWHEQFARVSRWLARFRQTDETRTHDRSSEFYRDELYAFFQNCYHLKDWLANDAASKPMVSDIESFIKNSPNMLLCRDVCNGSKHLRLKSPRQTSMGQSQFSVGLRAGGLTEVPPTISAKYEIISDGQSFDAFTIAQACMNEWDAYLKTKGLL